MPRLDRDGVYRYIRGPKAGQPVPTCVQIAEGNGIIGRGGARKRLANPLTTEPSYTVEERIFMGAVQAYKEAEHRPFPTLCEILAVLHSLGYRKVAEPTEPPTFKRRT